MQFDRLPTSYRQNFEKLKELLKQSSEFGLKSQSPAFIEAFSQYYLRCLTTLTQIKVNPEWKKEAQYGQSLLAQATILLYPEDENSLARIGQAIWTYFPAQLWRLRYFHLTSLGIIVLFTLLGFIIVHQNFEMASVFIPGMLRSSHDLDAYLFSTQAQHKMLTTGRDWDILKKSAFAQFLMLNNILVAVKCYLLGFLFGIPTVWVLIQTGLMLGTLPALFYGGDFTGIVAWLAPHGVPEVSAIILAGGAGLKVGLTMLSPGEQRMSYALKCTIKGTIGTLLICVVLLIWAGIVESFVRQSTLSNNDRLIIAGVSFIPLILLFLRGYLAQCRLEAVARQRAFRTGGEQTAQIAPRDLISR